ncbi:hypothetical protein [Modicisalibacter sp. MOD 31.J]|uniref:hypothetical protein n=1 Tax=Modicisalibacter sp. MOD 31.J TaxID=2831897 RepID=UPI001CCA9890|nr:hypothetical protein [Modicisalibacter sp. MOD 31.J]MBZ9574583.1 hypothetical protein [Modicisalibacter sp. MOD 31.J]
MWQQIDGYIAFYVVFGVLVYTISSVETIARMKPMKGTLAHALLFVAVGPLVTLGVVAKALVVEVVDATKCWRRLFRRNCGTEEVLLGTLWLWCTVDLILVLGLYGFALITGLTWLCLWQSARAMQKLHEMPAEKHLKARGAHDAFLELARGMAKRGQGSYVTEAGIRQLAHEYLQEAHPTPSPDVLDKYQTLRGEVVPALARDAREQRGLFHRRTLREVRALGGIIRASLETN